MSINKYEQDLLSLINTARGQKNQLNLSTILISIKCDNDELQEIFEFFQSKGISVLTEDIEPDTDSDQDNYETNSKIIPFDPSKIDIKMDKLTVESLIRRIRYDEVEFYSSFQRKEGLWDLKKKSQLIESMMLRIPLPAFYFDASDDDKWLIIDGLQRLGTIKDFVVLESFTLEGLEFLKDFNDLKYSELPRSMQRRIEETNINAYLVSPATPKNVKFNIFKRINTGGLTLEPQEIRNALYQGQATEFINKLAKMPCFSKATAGSVRSERMEDREFCVRFVAFAILHMKTYTGTIDDFLNEAMEHLAACPTDELNKIESDFFRTMQACADIFGRNAFRKMFDDRRRRPINKALFESWSAVIVNLSDKRLQVLKKNRETLIKTFMNLCEEENFQAALKSSDRKSLQSIIQRLNELVTDLA